MKYIKLFENYQDIDIICKKYRISNYIINEDGSIDVDGWIYNEKLLELPLKFSNVNGNFSCGGNQLSTLEGSPGSVGGQFGCSSNQLTTLKGGPENVDGKLYCINNKLITLKYFPKVNGDIIKIDYGTLPREIYRNRKYIKDIVKLQDEYQIWNKDNTLNINRFNVMMSEIKK